MTKGGSVGDSPIDLRRSSASAFVTTADDQTIYWKNDGDWDNELNSLKSVREYLGLVGEQPKADEAPEREAVDDKVPLSIYKEGSETKDVESRVSACICYGGKYVSATLRIGAAPAAASRIDPKEVERDWEAGPCHNSDKFFFSTTEIIRTILEVVKCPTGNKDEENSPIPTGLIVLNGSTNSGKSIIAKALALTIMRTAVRQSLANQSLRRPHLVAYEDPTEKWLIRKSERTKQTLLIATPNETLQFGFTATLRDKKHDRTSLEFALKDALRQTPTVMYVGEVRDPKEWEKILDFAGTGHLIITTAHAATLTESMSRIISAAKADTPAKRREVASRILACIHVEQKSIDTKDKPRPGPISLLAPAIWHRTPLGISSLVATGLSSVHANRRFVLGREMFFEKVVAGMSKSKRRGVSLEHGRKAVSEIDQSELVG